MGPSILATTDGCDSPGWSPGGCDASESNVAPIGARCFALVGHMSLRWHNAFVPPLDFSRHFKHTSPL
eukprot:8328289-Pyramimonas_sp.AAC.1